MRLYKGPQKTLVCSEITEARTTAQRLVGLIGTRQLHDRGVWFKACNSIHTFFMSIPIDVVYLDKHMTVCRVDHSLKPWRFPLPSWKARSVIELPAGWAMEKQLNIGDALYVGD